MPVLFPASASSSSCLATFLTVSKNVLLSFPLILGYHPQYIVPELPQGAPQLLHVEVDGVVILESTANVRTVLAEIQRVVQDHFVAVKEIFSNRINYKLTTNPPTSVCRICTRPQRRSSRTSSLGRGRGGWSC